MNILLIGKLNPYTTLNKVHFRYKSIFSRMLTYLICQVCGVYNFNYIVKYKELFDWQRIALVHKVRSYFEHKQKVCEQGEQDIVRVHHRPFIHEAHWEKKKKVKS